ncbi:MAG: oxidoreductase [Candidatus Saccharibacteria bacterium]|nr:oxidoreductase [Candidatus Saccharibacteria bacterium]
MLRALDNLLNKITMYQLVLWLLRILAGISIALAVFGVIGVSAKGLFISLGLLSVTCYLANLIFSRIWRVPTNTESYAITLLILFFILPPVTTEIRAIGVVLAGIIAMASKFMFATNGKHIFNPAAIAPVVLGMLGLMHANWWVGSSVLWPLTLIMGLLVVRKIRRFSLVLTFAAVSHIVFAITALQQGTNVLEALQLAVISSPLIFLGTIMLTEPATMPARRQQQIIFGALVGLLYASSLDIGPLHIYPETALIIGNLYAFAVNPRYRLRLKLKEIQHVSDRVANYVFTPDRIPAFQPGQYMEYTLDHEKQDSRGNRRTFSIASSPTENTIQMGVKFYEPSSRFKQALRVMKPGDTMYAGQIAGDFTMPANKSEKLVFIAGGIGITPFRSMLKYLLDSGETRDIIMIYAVSDPSEVAYADILAAAERNGIKVIGLLTSGVSAQDWQGSTGTLDAAFISEKIPDYKNRTIYISGPNAMVQNTESILRGMSAKKIKTDYFTGY